MRDDMTLVHEFAADQSEPAFAALVERHLGLVHSAARRQVGDDHLADPQHPDPYLAMAENSRLMLDGILNFGSQSIVPGSVVWKGDEFEARLSQGITHHLDKIVVTQNGHSITNDNPVSLARLYGKVKIENNFVKELKVGHRMEDGTPIGAVPYTYTYDVHSNLPKGIPSKIYFGRETYVIEKVVLADQNSFDPEAFNPTNFVVPELTMLTVVSNGQTVVKPVWNKKVQALINQDLKR